MVAVQAREWVTAVEEPEKTSTVVTNSIPPACRVSLCVENPLLEFGAVELPANVQPREKLDENSSLT